MLLSAALLFAACMDDDDDIEITLYNDIAITNFGITSATVYRQTVAEDGTVTTTSYSDGSVAYYPFTIDHLRGEIYNADSLPVGTDATKLLCTYSTKNNGLVYIESMMGDTWDMLTAVDSTNFSAPRYLQVVASDNSVSRQYKVTVNVHKEAADEFRWTQLAGSAVLAALDDMKAVVVGGTLTVLGRTGGTTAVYTSADGNTWTQTPALLGAGAWRNVAVQAGALYVLDGGVLRRSDDGGQTFADVTYVTDGFGLAQLAGAGTKEMYALTGDGRIAVSADGGHTWTADEGTDDDAAWLPVDDVTMTCTPFAYNDMTDYVVLAGNRSDDADATAVVWRKIAEYAPGSKAGKWTYMQADDTNRYPLPRMAGLAVTGYDGNLLALGMGGKGGCTAEPFSQLYESRDGGITWKTSSTYYIPSGFDREATSFAMTSDDSGRLWIVCGGSGQVWSGRLNRLTWNK